MTFIFTFLIFLLVAVAMALGVIFGRKRLQGSCAGLASVGIDKNCDCDVTCEQHQNVYEIQEPTKS